MWKGHFTINSSGARISTIVLRVLLWKKINWEILQFWHKKICPASRLIFIPIAQKWYPDKICKKQIYFIGNGKCTELNLVWLCLISCSCGSACTVCAHECMVSLLERNCTGEKWRGDSFSGKISNSVTLDLKKTHGTSWKTQSHNRMNSSG